MTPSALEAAPNALLPLSRHHYTGTCWWCGGRADSREHRHKASDLRREFSEGEYRKGDVIVRRDEAALIVRGPNSKTAKYGDDFCQTCNNTRSQPFDRAYDRFIEWYLAHERDVERSGVLRPDEMHDDWQVGTTNVLQYFAKHIGCRIADSGYTVPASLRAFLDDGQEPAGLVFSFEINAMLAELHAVLEEYPAEHGSSGMLMLGPVSGK